MLTRFINTDVNRNSKKCILKNYLNDVVNSVAKEWQAMLPVAATYWYYATHIHLK